MCKIRVHRTFLVGPRGVVRQIFLHLRTANEMPDKMVKPEFGIMP
jgi:hypothetical protein